MIQEKIAPQQTQKKWGEMSPEEITVLNEKLKKDYPEFMSKMQILQKKYSA